MGSYLIKCTTNKQGKKREYWLNEKFDLSLDIEEVKVFDAYKDVKEIADRLGKIRKYKEDGFIFTILDFNKKAV